MSGRGRRLEPRFHDIRKDRSRTQALLAGGLLKHQAPSPVPAQQVHTVVQLHLAKAVRAPGLTGRRSTPLEGRRSGPSCTSPSRPSAAEGKGRRRRRPFGGPATAAVSAGCVPKEGSECCIQLVGLAGVSMPAVAKALQRLAKSGERGAPHAGALPLPLPLTCTSHRKLPLLH